VLIDELKALLKQTPGDALAFAPETIQPDRLAETLAALANAAGGILLIGVTGRGRPKGVADPEKSLDQVIEAAFACDPPLIIPLPQPIQLEDKTLLLVQVPAGLPHVLAAKINGQQWPQ